MKSSKYMLFMVLSMVVRRFMRNPALVKAGAAGAALTVFEGFYDIGTMLYCSMHCCGE